MRSAPHSFPTAHRPAPMITSTTNSRHSQPSRPVRGRCRSRLHAAPQRSARTGSTLPPDSPRPTRRPANRCGRASTAASTVAEGRLDHLLEHVPQLRRIAAIVAASSDHDHLGVGVAQQFEVGARRPGYAGPSQDRVRGERALALATAASDRARCRRHQAGSARQPAGSVDWASSRASAGTVWPGRPLRPGLTSTVERNRRCAAGTRARGLPCRGHHPPGRCYGWTSEQAPVAALHSAAGGPHWSADGRAGSARALAPWRAKCWPAWPRPRLRAPPREARNAAVCAPPAPARRRGCRTNG